MEFYCNTNYYGNGCYGVESASNYYFSKSSKDLEINEAAILVALSNNPSYYNPILHPENALEKRNKIIEKFYKNGFISNEIAQIEEKKKLELNISNKSNDNFETYLSTYALHSLALEMMKQDNFIFKYTFENKEDYDEYIQKYEEEYLKKTEEIRNGGYKVYTSLDNNLQKNLQNILNQNLSKYKEIDENTNKYTMQGSAVLIDNKTGYVKAIVGGRSLPNSETDDNFNRAYISARQPGSAIKPLLDYTPAFDLGIYLSPSVIVSDTEIENGPKNSNGNYIGDIPLREAVARSINTVAYNTLQKVGVNTGLKYLDKMRFHKISYIDNDTSSIAIGGFTNGIRNVDLAKGYFTLANKGVYKDNTCIISVKNELNNIILEPNPKEVRVYDEDAAFLMSDVLKDVLEKPYGTGSKLKLSKNVAAAKSGTTNDSKDTWFAGYTKNYTLSVWVGYDTPRSMKGIYGSTIAGTIWKEYMEQLYANIENEDFEKPETIYLDNVNGTEIQDYFSSNIQEKMEKNIDEKDDEKHIEEISIKVDNYLNTGISNISDTFDIDKKFDNIKSEVIFIRNSKVKKELLLKISHKYENLLKEKENLKKEIEIYNKNEEQRKKQERENNLLLIKNKLNQNKLKIYEDQLNLDLDMINKLLYKTDYNIGKLDLKLNELGEFIKENKLDINEFNKSLEKVNKAKEYYNNLPTLEEYNKEKNEKYSEINDYLNKNPKSNINLIGPGENLQTGNSDKKTSGVSDNLN